MTIDNNLLADSYDAAADYIEQHGWYRGYFAPGTFGTNMSVSKQIQTIQENKLPVCAMGAGYAVGVSLFPEGRPEAALIPATSAFSQINMSKWMRGLEHEIDGQCLPTWNDATGRAKEEVVDLLRITALKLRGPEAGNIGDNPREYEFEPMPASEPVTEPAAPQPVKEPQPA